MIMCKYLRMLLPMELQLDSNKKTRIVMCQLYQQNCRWIDKHQNSIGKSICNR